MSTRTVYDPFHGKDVQISDRLVDRLRGKYASGPHLPSGNPEFGWRQFQSPPIQHEAACRIAELEAALAYYADEDEYLWRGLDSEIEPRVLSDRGEIARAAVPHWESIEPKIPTQTE